MILNYKASFGLRVTRLYKSCNKNPCYLRFEFIQNQVFRLEKYQSLIYVSHFFNKQ